MTDITSMNRVQRGMLLESLLNELTDDELATLIDDLATMLNEKGYDWQMKEVSI